MKTRFTNTILALSLAGLLAPAAAMALPGEPGEGNGRFGKDMRPSGNPVQQVARMSERLDLTSEQEDAILEFLRERESDREAMRARIMDSFGDEICDQRAADRAEFDALMAGILDEEQLQSHEEMKAKMEQRRANREGRQGSRGLECPDS